MAKETAAPVQDDEALQRYAFALFTHRSSSPHRRAADQLTVECFRDAEAFMETAQKILAGALDTAKPTGPQLSDVSAPNLKPTHPLNLVSKRFGDLDKVKLIHTRLIKDPAAKTLSEYDWGEAEVLTARSVFPAYVGN